MSTEDFDTMDPGADELFAGLHRSVAGATMTTSAADVMALGRRTRTRHRAVAAGIGTGAAAIVAAIGVLAPSTGSGPGGVPSAAGQGAVTTTPATTSTTAAPSGGQELNIREVGFSLEEHADGTVLLSLDDAFDPAKLQAAMDQAGIPAAILVRQISDSSLNKGTIIQCTPDPGVHAVASGADKILTDFTSGPLPKLKFNKSEIPAGEYVTLERFESHGKIISGSFSIKVGRQTTCVPEPWYPGGKPGN